MESTAEDAAVFSSSQLAPEGNIQDHNVPLNRHGNFPEFPCLHKHMKNALTLTTNNNMD